MPWRDALLAGFGPGVLGGVTPALWWRALRENRFAVDPSRLPRALAITLHSMQNGVMHLGDVLRERRATPREIPPPIFLLGHWRNGTTHLHNLLSVDDRFAFPNTFQALFPNTFLTTEAVNAPLIGYFLPKRRPMDNVEWSMASPQEDEWALCITTLKSPSMSLVFPRRREYYDRYLTFRDVPEVEVEEWRAAFRRFLRKLHIKHGFDHPLLLKSPQHTARIRLLLETFPGARFVHIHRNPYAVFPSTRKTLRVSTEMSTLQRPSLDDEDWILGQYRRMYEAFFEDRTLIPPGYFHEVGFEALEVDPIGEIRKLYESLGLPDFAHVEPPLRKYVDSLAGYKKNTFPALSDDLRRRIADEWRPCFREWRYPE